MSKGAPTLHGRSWAALAIACLALALSAYAALRGRSVPPAGSGACVDPEAREQLDQLRRLVADRDALAARLARAANAAGGSSAASEGPQRPAAPDPGARRYVHFVIPNPAVSVTPKDDGTYDIRTTDPSLAGSVMQITAVTQAGDEEQVMIRIPE